MSGQNDFFPGPSDLSFYGFYNGNEEFSACVESNLLECFYRGNVFQTMTLPDAVKSTTKDGFENDVYSSEPYVF